MLKKRHYKRHKLSTFFAILLTASLWTGMMPLEGVALEAQRDIHFVSRIQELPANLRTLVSQDIIDHAANVSTCADADRIDVIPSENLYEIHTLTADGQGALDQFLVPIKYVDDNGRTQYIDTSMKSTGLWRSLTSPYDYQNAANAFTVEYAKDPGIGLKLDDDFTMAVKDPSLAAQDAYTATDAETGDGKIVYPKAFGEHTYVEYINTSTGFKENIVLEQNTGKNTFDFIFRSSALIPVVTDNGFAIELRRPSSQEVVYTVSPLYVYDSYVRQGDEVYEPGDFRHNTDDCSYQVTQTTAGEYTITAVVPAEWLNDPAVVYPVTIDPTVTSSVESSDITDTSAVQGNPAAYYHGYGFTYVGYSSSANRLRMYSFIKFGTLPTVPSNTNIYEATLTVKFRSGQTTAGDGACHRVTSSRNFNALCWNNQPTVATSALSFSSHHNVTQYVFDITDTVSGWYSGILPNYGLRVGYRSESVQDFNTLYSSEASSASNAPKLTVKYSTTAPYSINTNETYFIRNLVSGKYLAVQGGATGTNVIQYTFNGQDNQKWRLDYVGGGFYEFVPLCAPTKRLDIVNASTSPGTNIQIFPRNPAYEAQSFQFVHFGNRQVLIKAKLDSSSVLSVANGSIDSSANVELNTEGAYDNQIWVLEKAGHFTVSILQYYDQAYAARYPGAAGTENSPASKIASYQQIVTDYFSEVLDITLITTTAQPYTSTADGCTHRTDYNSLCTRSLNNGICNLSNTHRHCTNALQMLTELPGGLSAVPAKTKIMKWTGNTLCKDCTDTHSEQFVGGLTSDPNMIVCWSNTLDGNDNIRQQVSVGTLAHEFGHSIGAVGDNSGTCTNDYCVMKYGVTDDVKLANLQAKRAGTYCSYCHMKMIQYLNEYGY